MYVKCKGEKWWCDQPCCGGLILWQQTISHPSRSVFGLRWYFHYACFAERLLEVEMPACCCKRKRIKAFRSLASDCRMWKTSSSCKHITQLTVTPKSEESTPSLHDHMNLSQAEMRQSEHYVAHSHLTDLRWLAACSQMQHMEGEHGKGNMDGETWKGNMKGKHEREHGRGTWMGKLEGEHGRQTLKRELEWGTWKGNMEKGTWKGRNMKGKHERATWKENMETGTVH